MHSTFHWEVELAISTFFRRSNSKGTGKDYMKPIVLMIAALRFLKVITPLISQGRQYKYISDDLFISLDTVKRHVKNILKSRGRR